MRWNGWEIHSEAWSRGRERCRTIPASLCLIVHSVNYVSMGWVFATLTWFGAWPRTREESELVNWKQLEPKLWLVLVTSGKWVRGSWGLMSHQLTTSDLENQISLKSSKIMHSQCLEIYPDHGEMLSSAYISELFLPTWEWCTHLGWLWRCMVCRGVGVQDHMCFIWCWTGSHITPSEGEHRCSRISSEYGHQKYITLALERALDIIWSHGLILWTCELRVRKEVALPIIPALIQSSLGL